MSELVEKVAKAIIAKELDLDGFAPGTDDRDDIMAAIEREWKLYTPEARAAIKAVAEWLHGEGDDLYDAAYAKLLLAQLEDKT